MKLPKTIEFQFSLSETGGESVTRVGITKDGVTDIILPDFILENKNTTEDYNAFCFLFVSEKDFGFTDKKIILQIKARPKPETYKPSEEENPFKDVLLETRGLTERAENASNMAKSYAVGSTGLRENEEVDNTKYFYTETKKLNDNVVEKEKEFLNKQENAVKEINKTKEDSILLFSNNSEDKTKSFNENSENKTKEFNDNAVKNKKEIDLQVEKAKESADNAKVSETNAKSSETKAKTSETNSKTSETKSEQAFSDLLKMLGSSVATLVDGKIPLKQIPATAIHNSIPVRSEEDLTKISAQEGDVAYIISPVNGVLTITKEWQLLGQDSTDRNNWFPCGSSYAVMASLAEIANKANDSERINGLRVATLTEKEFENAVKDDNTIYGVEGV